MADLLELSSRLIDTGDATTPSNRITNELSEVAEGVAVVESFSHAWALRTTDGLVVVDASGPATGSAVVQALRRWSPEPVHTLVYTHGHVDHVGGSGAFVADARRSGARDPAVVGHAAIAGRLARYERTNGWNLAVNARQFGGIRPRAGFGVGGLDRFLPADTAWPTTTYTDRLSLCVGGLDLQLRHARGETDDHTWIWIPSRRAVAVGDFLTWVFPNAGNPQKVQRYPGEWAAALRAMAALEPELLLPAHGLPIGGQERIARVLGHVAGALERLVDEVLARMNLGATLDEITAEVEVDEGVLALPYLRPVYDEPEFIVRNIWRQYGGWWDGNPARLKPPRDAAVGREVAALAGGVGPLLDRAEALAADGAGDDDLRLACQLVEWAAQAAPDDARARATRAATYEQRRRAERSLMAKGVFAGAARESSDPP